MSSSGQDTPDLVTSGRDRPSPEPPGLDGPTSGAPDRGAPDRDAPDRAEPGEYELDDDPARVDRGAVIGFLADQAYWGRWRTPDIVHRQLDGAWRVVAAYHRPTGDLVGFARAVSDGVALAYLADVFVLAEHRGHGLGRALVRRMIDEGPGAGFRWLLHTRDAHPLYAGFGFAAPDHTLMERPADPALGTLAPPVP